MRPYRPFMTDPAHIAGLEGQRYVVLRAAGTVADAYERVGAQVREELSGSPVSYPAEPHVTLAGLAPGPSVDALRDLVTEWACDVPPLKIEIELIGVFPTAQIVIVQVRKTTALFHALSSIRERATRHGFHDLAVIAPSDWIFHMSVAYCAALDAPAWARVTRFVETLDRPRAECILGEVEVVAFDDNREYSGGVVHLTGS